MHRRYFDENQHSEQNPNFSIGGLIIPDHHAHELEDMHWERSLLRDVLASRWAPGGASRSVNRAPTGVSLDDRDSKKPRGDGATRNTASNLTT